MSRPTLPPATIVGDIDLTTNPAEDEKVRQLIDQARAQAFEFGTRVGKADAMVFIATVADKATVLEYREIKKSKEYKDLPYKDSEGKVRRVATFDEFCRVRWGKSYRRMQEIEANFELIGAELFEQSQRIGLTQKDFAAIKALPEDEREAIKAAIAEGDPQSVYGVLEELAARNAAAKAAAKTEEAKLRKEIEEQKGNLAARERLLAEKNARIDELHTDLNRLRDVAVDPDWPSEFSYLMDLVGAAEKQLAQAISALHSVSEKATSIESRDKTEFNERALESAKAALAQKIAGAINVGVGTLEKYGALFDKTLGAWLPE